MKRILCVTCGILMLASSAVAEETCANGKGKLVQDHDGNNYCVSQVKMNWFSAFSWCETIGGQLPTLEDCNCKKCSSTAAMCDNLDPVSGAGGNVVWTSQNAGSDKVWTIARPAGRRIDSKTSRFSAVCKMP